MMRISLSRDGQTLELDDPLLRALSTSIFDSVRSASARLFHAQRAGRRQQADEHRIHLGRLQRVVDFLLADEGVQTANRI